MTFEELNKVRVIHSELTRAARNLEVWKRASTLRTPSIDGLSKSKSTISSVERIALKVVEAERRVATLQENLSLAIPILEKKICAEFNNSRVQTLLLFRYVECMFFRDIAEIMHYSEKHIYRLHDRILKGLAKY